MKKITFLIAFVATTMFSFGADMAGTYTVGTGGTYATLGAAVADLNAATITGDVVLNIISDLTEPVNIGLCKDFGNYSLLIKPNEDVDRVVTFTQSGDNGSSSGNFIIGLSDIDSWSSIGTSKNITIDGYASGGSTRRLTFQNQSTNINTCKPFVIMGNTDNINIKNCILLDKTSGSSAFGVVSVRVRVESSVDYIPNNITVDNCIISSVSTTAAGIFVSNSYIPTGRPVGIVFKNNKIEVKHRGISLNYAGSSDVYNNEIKVNQTASGMASFGIGGTSAGLVLTNVYNNRIIQLGTSNTGGGGNGIRGIQASAGGTWNIYNNFITGFATPATGTTETAGIRVGSASNVYHNTIVINNVSTTGPGTTPTAGIVSYNASTDIRNNIIITEEDDFASYCIYASSMPATSDYNLLYRSGTTNANIGYAAGAAQATLGDWQTATSKDANSKSAPVYFLDAANGDLRLTGASEHDDYLAVPKMTEVPNDMFGTVRSSPYTYAGAHHSVMPFYWTSVATPTVSPRILRTYDGVQIELEGTSTVEIYTTSGMLIDKVRTSGTYTKDLNSGVYIICIDGQATKFMK